MNIQTVKKNLIKNEIFYSKVEILDRPTVIGYEKIFRWRWFATQLNTFIVVTDFGDEEITIPIIENHLSESFHFAKKNYKGFPRGLQSGLAVISILISNNTSIEAQTYCEQLKSGKKWAGFSIPVIFNSSKKELYEFKKNPIWGIIYYPHLRKLLNAVGWVER